jgi:hypothetical protein
VCKQRVAPHQRCLLGSHTSGSDRSPLAAPAALHLPLDLEGGLVDRCAEVVVRPWAERQSRESENVRGQFEAAVAGGKQLGAFSAERAGEQPELEDDVVTH